MDPKGPGSELQESRGAAPLLLISALALAAATLIRPRASPRPCAAATPARGDPGRSGGETPPRQGRAAPPAVDAAAPQAPRLGRHPPAGLDRRRRDTLARDYWQVARSTVTVVPVTATIPTLAPFAHELERTIALCAELQSIDPVDPAKVFPSAESESAPSLVEVLTQRPARLGLDPATAWSWFSPGSPATPRSIDARSLDVDDVTRRPFSLLFSSTLERSLTVSPPTSWTPCLVLPHATRPRAVDSGAPAVSKISSPSKALPETTTVPC